MGISDISQRFCLIILLTITILFSECANAGSGIETDYNFPLHAAVQAGDAETVRFLIDQGADVNEVDFERNTPLYYSALEKRRDIADMLVAAGAIADDLVSAALLGETQAVREFAESAGDLDNYRPTLVSILPYIAESGNGETVEFFLRELGRDFSQSCKRCLKDAIESGNLAAASGLVDFGADLNGSYEYITPLEYCVDNDEMDILKMLLERGADPDAMSPDYYGTTALTVAAAQGKKDFVKVLLDAGANPNAKNYDDTTPLFAALYMGHKDIADILLSHGAEVEVEMAAAFGFADVVEEELKNGLDPNMHSLEDYSRGVSLLHWAAIGGHSNIVKMLLEAGANVDSMYVSYRMVDSDPYYQPTGDTPLLWAASRGDYDTVKLLIENGADVNWEAFDGITPIKAAAEGWHPEIVDLLVEHGAEFLAGEEETHALYTCTPLHAAAKSGRLETAQRLIDSGMDVNQENVVPEDASVWDDRGVTPLHYAAEYGHHEMVNLLIENGANINAETVRNFECVTPRGGVTPIQLAAAAGYYETVKLLIDNGADITIKAVNERTALGNTIIGCRRWTRDYDPESVDDSLEYNSQIPYLSAGPGYDFNTKFEGFWFEREPREMEGVDCVETASLLMDGGAKQERHFAKDVVEYCWQKDHSPKNIAWCASLLKLFLDRGEGFTENDPYWKSLVDAVAGKENVQERVQYTAVLMEYAEDNGLPVDNIDISESKYDGMSMYVFPDPGNENLMDALKKRYVDPETVIAIIRKGADVNANPSSDEYAPLHMSVRRRQYHEVRELLAAGADVNAVGPYNYTPLQWAAKTGNTRIVKLLLDSGADITARDIKNATPLHRAAEGGHVAVVRLLLEAGSDINAEDSQGLTPVQLASRNYKKETSKFLVSQGATPGITTLAILGNTEELLKRIREKKDLDVQFADGRTLVHWAVENDEATVFDALVDADPGLIEVADYSGRTPLFESVEIGSVSITEKLLAEGASPTVKDQKNQTLLRTAVTLGHVEIAGILIDAGNDVNDSNGYGDTLLHRAVSKGNPDMVALLISKGADTEANSSYGSTPFMAIAGSGAGAVEMLSLFLNSWPSEEKRMRKLNELLTGICNVYYGTCRDFEFELIKAVIDAGADVNSKGDHGTVLSNVIGSYEFNEKQVEYLLEKGADINRDPSVFVGAVGDVFQWDIVSFLLAHGADVNVRDEDGDTALHVAARTGEIDMAYFLIDHGADPTIKNNAGKTPFDVVCANEQEWCVEPRFRTLLETYAK